MRANATAFFATSGLIGKSYQLEMRPGHDWIESANLWGLVIGNPASLKSPTIPTIKSVSNLCLKPLDANAKLVFDSAMRNHKVSLKNLKKNKLILKNPSLFVEDFIWMTLQLHL